MFKGSENEKLSPERMTLILEQFVIAAYALLGNRK
jgi:hypothetical protein